MNLNDYKKEFFSRPVGCVHKISYGNDQSFFHWHPHYEITLIRSGKYILENNMTVVRSDRPVVFVHRPFCLHRLNAESSCLYDRYIIYIDRSVVNEFRDTLSDLSWLSEATLVCISPDKDEFDELLWLAEKLYDAVGHDYCAVEKYNPAKGAIISAHILCDILDILRDERGQVFTTRYSYIQDVLQDVSGNLSEPKTIGELSEKFGVGHSKLTDDFRTATGTTYKRYMTDLRMTKARELLSAGAEIIDVALEIGYSSEAHFITAYKRYWGETPGRFSKSKK